MSIDTDPATADGNTIPALVGCTDVEVWAREFVRVAREQPGMPLDEGAMICWFANAMMAKADAVRRQQCRHRRWIAPGMEGKVSGLPRPLLATFGALCAKCGEPA